MKVLTAFALIILAGWALIKVISLVVRGLVHLLIVGLPVLGAIAGVCLLLVLGSRITARAQRQRSPQPSEPPAAPSRRTTSVAPAPVPSPEWPIRPAAPASRPAQYRWQPSTESGHAEASPVSGAERSGTHPASPGARPGSPGYGVAALGCGASRQARRQRRWCPGDRAPDGDCAPDWPVAFQPGSCCRAVLAQGSSSAPALKSDDTPAGKPGRPS